MASLRPRAIPPDCQLGGFWKRFQASVWRWPELRLLRDHNHFSAGHSIGTRDTSVSVPLADFIRRHAA